MKIDDIINIDFSSEPQIRQAFAINYGIIFLTNFVTPHITTALPWKGSSNEGSQHVFYVNTPSLELSFS